MQITNKTKGILWILFSGLSFSLMTLFVRLSGDLPSMQKALFRNLIAFFVVYIPMKRKGRKLDIHRDNIADLLCRASFGTIGLLANFYAADHLLLSDASMLNKLSPFSTIIMSYFLLKEKSNRFDWMTVGLAFIGALFVVKPGFNMEPLAGFVGVMGGIAAGAAYTFVRKMGLRGISSDTIITFFSCFSTLIVLPFVLANPQPMTGKQFFYLILVGIFAAGGQLGITKAYLYAPAKEISAYNYIQVIYAAFWGWLVFGQLPDGYSFLGYIIIVAAGLARFLKDKREKFDE